MVGKNKQRHRFIIYSGAYNCEAPVFNYNSHGGVAVEADVQVVLQSVH